MKRIAHKLVLSLEGSSPEAIAFVVALGLVLGVFPVFWCPTVMCTAAAVGFRLNLAAIHLVNQISTPLQLALLVPFNRVGGWILGPHSSWNILTAAADALTGWICLGVPLGILLYWSLLFLLRWGSRSCFKMIEEPTPAR